LLKRYIITIPAVTRMDEWTSADTWVRTAIAAGGWPARIWKLSAEKDCIVKKTPLVSYEVGTENRYAVNLSLSAYLTLTSHSHHTAAINYTVTALSIKPCRHVGGILYWECVKVRKSEILRHVYSNFRRPCFYLCVISTHVIPAIYTTISHVNQHFVRSVTEFLATPTETPLAPAFRDIVPTRHQPSKWEREHRQQLHEIRK